MSSKNIISLLLIALVFSSARGATIPSAVDLETCIDLCSSCDGIAEYKEGHCECSISTSLDDGAECLTRMKRQAQEIGLDIVSCDTNEESRSTRCALGSKHSYGKSDIERVAKYFMQDGPMTGSVFIAPPYTQQVVPLVSQAVPVVAQAVPMVGQTMLGQSADCGSGNIVGSPQTQPASTIPEETKVGAPNLITQPKEFMPADSAPSTPDVAAPKSKLGAMKSKLGAPKSPAVGAPQSTAPSLGAPKTLSPLTLPRIPLDQLSFSQMTPKILSFLGEMISKPLIGLPDAIESVGRTPAVNQLVQAPATLLNTLADQMTMNDQVAKANLDNFRDVVGKAQEKVQNDLENLKEAAKTAASQSNPSAGSPMMNQPSYSIVNPHPMLSWLNPTVGSPAPMQLLGTSAPAQIVSAPTPMQIVSAPTPMQIVGAQAPMQIVGAQAPMQLVGATQLVNTGVPSQMVGAPASGNSNCGQSQMVGSPSPSFNNQQQMVGAAVPSMISTVPMYQSLGTIPLSSIVSQMSPTYLVGSPMTYYPAMQTVDDNHVESLEEVPLSSPPQKKICKKSTKDQPSMKYARDVKAVEDEKEKPEVKFEQTTTTTTEVPMIDRTTTQKPKEKTKEDKSVIGKIKPLSKNKADKKIAEVQF